MDYSKESVEILQKEASDFLMEEQPNIDKLMSTLKLEKREIKDLRVKLNESRDTADRLAIVNLIRKPKSKR